MALDLAQRWSGVTARIRPIHPVSLLILGVSLLGFALRCEHALTFDGPAKGSDYATHMFGVKWMMEHHRPFRFDPSLGAHNWSIGYQAPLWYALGGIILRWTHVERAIAFLAVVGWAVRQLLLARLLTQAIPTHRWSRLAALTIHAVLPIGVLTDGKVNPEGLHSTLFTVSLYFLWKIEGQAVRPEGVSAWTATAFGAFAGLAVIAKATAAILPVTAVVVLAWRAWAMRRRQDEPLPWMALWRRLARPALVAGAVWLVVAGWWCVPNVIRHGHPFPHTWDRETAAEQPILALPTLYRRPLGWALPVEWGVYLKTPVIRSEVDPRPNLWGIMVVGTWSDFYNRGFCRLDGGQSDPGFWGGWPVTLRCLTLFSALASIGCLIALGAAFSVFRTAWRHLRTGGQDGSLALPVAILLGVIFPSLFALVYPYDRFAVSNPRYLLPVSMAMSACLGFTLAAWERARVGFRLARWALMAAVAAVALLVIYERWGS